MIKSACDLQTVKSGKKCSLGVPANNFLFAGRVPANNFLFAGRVPANNLFLYRNGAHEHRVNGGYGSNDTSDWGKSWSLWVFG